MISTTNGNRRVCFIVEGRPVAKARPRATRRGVVYTPKTTQVAEARIREAFFDAYGDHFKPLECPVGVSVDFYFSQPKGVSMKQKEAQAGKPRAKKPDVDNLIKTVLDALNGVVWKDDNQVVSIKARKINSISKDYTEIRIEYGGY